LGEKIQGVLGIVQVIWNRVWNRPICRFISKWYEIWRWLQWKTNRNLWSVKWCHFQWRPV